MGRSNTAAVRSRTAARRVPLTITLDAKTYAFIESCVALKEFRSVDEFFDAALTCYRKHLHALRAYEELQSHTGLSRKEILESIECETVVTKTAGRRRRRVRV